MAHTPVHEVFITAHDDKHKYKFLTGKCPMIDHALDTDGRTKTYKEKTNFASTPPVGKFSRQFKNVENISLNKYHRNINRNGNKGF